MGGCNVCSAELRALWTTDGANSLIQPYGQKCPVCESRPRIRAMVYSIDQKLRPEMEKLGLLGKAHSLLMAAPQVEQDLMNELLGSYVTTSLYGRYSPSHVVSNAEDLKEFGDREFDLVEACGVFDFIENAESAFESVARVLRPQSVLFFHVGEGHLRDDDSPPKLKRYRTDWSVNYYPEDYQQPIMIFGRGWIHNKLHSLGFKTEEIRWTDPGTQKSLTWWLGLRA